MDAEAITRFSQGLVDALDLRDNVLKHIRFGEIVTDGFDCYPFAQRIFSLKDENYLYTPPTNFWHKSHKPVITFDGVLASPWLGLDLPRTAAWIFSELEACFNAPVDIEFAVRVDDDPDEAHFYLLQCRPLSQREEMKPLSVPAVPDGRKIIFIPRQVPTAHLPGIEYIISVDPLKYKNWPASDKFAVARVIGKLNQTLEGKTFILIGPGRWGSGNPELGVSVKYSEIANTKMLVEVSIKEADYLPEVSYGTHFFQDLIEDRIIYVPIFPDEEDAFINTRFLSDGSVFGKILTDEYYARYGEVVSVIHVPSVAGGRLAEAVFDGHVDEGVVFVR
jgi:hypothetical protein